MNTAAGTATEGQAIVPGTEPHFQQPTKPKRTRGPSKKTREALEAARREGYNQAREEFPWLGLPISWALFLFAGIGIGAWFW